MWAFCDLTTCFALVPEVELVKRHIRLPPAAAKVVTEAGVMYRVGRKYELTLSPQYDLVRNEFRAFGGSLRRTFPDFDMNLNISYGLITDETTVGLSLSIPRQPGQGLPTY